ncbi:hypothetical protein ACWEF9_01385 [Streptomyces sp. NPDC004980]
MGFDEEWGRLRARAAEQHGSSMRLNGADEGPLPGLDGRADLASSPAQKKAAANTIENELEPSTKKATDWADESSATAVKEEIGAGTLTGQCEEFFTTWADLKDVPEAEREPTLRSCRSGAWTTSQRALKDLGG